jgi:hypothetical protein
MVLLIALGCGSKEQDTSERERVIAMPWQRADVPDPAAVYMFVFPRACQELREVVIHGTGGQVALTARGVERVGENVACTAEWKMACVRVRVRGHRPTEEFLDGATQYPAPTAVGRMNKLVRAQRAEGHDCPLIAVRDRRH